MFVLFRHLAYYTLVQGPQALIHRSQASDVCASMPYLSLAGVFSDAVGHEISRRST